MRFRSRWVVLVEVMNADLVACLGDLDDHSERPPAHAGEKRGAKGELRGVVIHFDIG